ncbi:BH3-interacting domain death agonist [Ascaphus truei]|uniref:BH3-interacting domain death agonist n=1 Tax=Ascaphus truei TaxID=8439 RepID=UPI003F5912AA
MAVDVELILLSFLESHRCSGNDDEFHHELVFLVDEVQSKTPQYRTLADDGELQTDGNLSGKKTRVETGGEEVDEALCCSIGAQLARMGDQLEGKIKQEVIDKLIEQMLNETLTEERFLEQVNSLLGSLPPGIEQESASVVIAMTLTTKMARNVPALLHRVFHCTAAYIQRNYLTCLLRLAGQR